MFTNILIDLLPSNLSLELLFYFTVRTSAGEISKWWLDINKNYHINTQVNKTTKEKVIPIHPRLDLDVIGIYFTKKKILL